MNNKSFVRKVIYISVIGALLIPLSLVSRPATRDSSNVVTDSGGKLAQMRDEYNLSQAKLMEIDPASETMKLATLGLRGVAVNLLWMQAIEHKKKENWDQLASTLQALIKVQPNFVKVWEYQAHNLSYNISMEFDDYEYRYHWVKKGIGFLRDGIPYNQRDHRMVDHLGFFTGMKIGRSDEKNSFRRMFRQDDAFHSDMEDYIEPDTYDTRYGHDNWRMAYEWYDLSRKMVEDQGYEQYNGDALFYMRQPAQLRNQASSLKDEFRPEETIQEIWRQAHEEWINYGQRQIVNTRGVMVTMEGMVEYGARIEKLREQIDAFVPEGTRETYTNEVIEAMNLNDEQKRILDLPPEQRTDEEAQQAAELTAIIFDSDKTIDLKIISHAKEEDRLPAKRLAEESMALLKQMYSIRQQDSVNNYRYWRERTQTEASELALQARRFLYDANEVRRQSIFDDEYQFDYKTKEKKVVRQGAISLYEEAFAAWKKVFDEYPNMQVGDLGDRIVDRLKEYEAMLKISGREWPENFPLQYFIDVRARNQQPDDLPTSEDIAERLADEAEAREEAMEDDIDESTSEDSDQDAESSENEDDEADGETEASKTEESSDDDQEEASEDSKSDENDNSDDDKSDESDESDDG